MNKFGKLSAVIWDLDGVIVDSEPQHFKSWHDTFQRYSLNITDSQLRQTFGMTSPVVMRTLLGADADEAFISKICNEKEALFRADIKDSAAYLPGVEFWLNQFKEAGIRQALASSGSMENIITTLDALGTRPFLEKVVSGIGLPSKPDPAIFLKAAHLLGVPANACLVIEDSLAGVAGAKAAGMKCLAVTTTNPAQALSVADVILRDLESLSVTMISDLFQ